MATFIKAGFWDKLCKPCKGYKGWLNLDEFITNIVTSLIPPVPTSTYKVFTALLTQSGGDSPQIIFSNETILKGVTYTINSIDGTTDLIPYGAPNNNIGTSFICNQNFNIWGEGSSELSYNEGAPVVTVLENTIGNIWFTYNTDGSYLVNSNELFTLNKTIGFITFNDCCVFRLADKPFLALDPSSINFVFISSAIDGLSTNDVIQNTPIEIRVYS